MKRFHVHARVDDLQRSIAFYSRLFAAEPSRVEADYAKWMLEDPRINFAISTWSGKRGVDHLGFQTDDAAELAELKARAQAADMTLLDEGETTCCYARSEKHWVTDPQGIAWEHFHTLSSIPTFSQTATGEGAPAKSACCAGAILLLRPRQRMPASALRKLLAEALGTALLLAVVIGSGVMAERLAQGNVALALLANTLATVGGLYALIEVFGPISGAHFNPAVSLVMAWRRAMPRWLLGPYVVAQLGGAVLGAWLAHAMFDLPILQLSTHERSGAGQWIAEGVATFGLLLVILRAPAGRVAAMVAAYIGAAYWFTASTSFANPAATLGRMLSDSFAGIAPASVPGFVVAELLGAVLALAANRALTPTPAGPPPGSEEVEKELEVSPHA